MLATFTRTNGRTYQIGRAPKGGIEFNGRAYRGGQFCPVEALPLSGGAPEREYREVCKGIFRVYDENKDGTRKQNRTWGYAILPASQVPDEARREADAAHESARAYAAETAEISRKLAEKAFRVTEADVAE